MTMPNTKRYGRVVISDDGVLYCFAKTGPFHRSRSSMWVVPIKKYGSIPSNHYIIKLTTTKPRVIKRNGVKYTIAINWNRLDPLGNVRFVVETEKI